MFRAVAAIAAAFTVHASPAATIQHVFQNQASTALCFAYRESRYQPGATHYNTNGSIDRGLFQINSVWVGTTVQWYQAGRGVHIKIDAGKLYRARYNARVAWAISHGGTSWGPWGYVC